VVYVKSKAVFQVDVLRKKGRYYAVMPKGSSLPLIQKPKPMKKLSFLASCFLLLIMSSLVSSVIPAGADAHPESENAVVKASAGLVSTANKSIALQSLAQQ